MEKVIYEQIISDFFHRCEGLFGRDYEPLVADIIYKSIDGGGMKDGILCSYPELPLKGESWLDWTIGVGEYLAHEYDLSKRGTDNPGRAVAYRDVKNIDKLRLINAEDFYEVLVNRMEGAREELSFGYASSFPGRNTRALRIGTYYRGDMDGSRLLSTIRDFGYTNIPREMKEIIDKVFRSFSGFDLLEIGFNILPDGSFTDDIGIMFPAPNINKRFSGNSKTLLKESGYEGFLSLLLAEGIIDKRIYRALDGVYNRKYIAPMVEKNAYIVSNAFRLIKLSWKSGQMQPAKMYYNFTIWK